MNTFDHQQNQLQSVRFDGPMQHTLPKKHNIEIYCSRHQDKIVYQGCLGQNCQKMIMCSKCNYDDRLHYEEHKDHIVEFSQFIELLAQEIKKTNRSDSVLYNKNVKTVLENEHSILVEYDNICKQQIKQFNIKIDEHVSLIIHHFQIMKQSIATFFEKQLNHFHNNVVYFKSQYKQMNPEETMARYGDAPSIIAKLSAKTPHQCFQFINNLRKSANMEGQLLADLDYISQLVLSTQHDKSFLIQDYSMNEISNAVHTMIEQTKTLLHDSLKQVPKINKEIHSSIVSQSFISYNRNQIRLNQQDLFDKIKYRFINVAQLQTHHSNSVSAIIALSDDIVATSSYDRSIRIWRLSTGTLIKTIYDTNCISCLVLMKISNDKNPQADSFTDEDQLRLNTQLMDGSISSAGFLLVSAGFDKSIKVWDFDMKPIPTMINKLESSLLSQPYHMSIFPITVLKGHNGWITALTSLNDEKNVVAGDDSGEAIIWDIINSTLMYRLTYLKNPGLMPFIALTIPFNQFCCASGSILRIYTTYYKSVDNMFQQQPNFKERLHAKFSQKQDPIQISPQLTNAILSKEVDIGWGILGCIAPVNHPNILVVFGQQPNKLKYVLLSQNKQVEINTDCSSYIGCMLLIEKHRIHDQEIDQFYKHINFIACGDKEMALYDGYGSKLRVLEGQGDDLYASNAICQRNLQILKLDKRGTRRTLRMACVSQFGTEAYKYKSSRITVFELQFDIL